MWIEKVKDGYRFRETYVDPPDGEAAQGCRYHEKQNESRPESCL